MPPRDWKLRIEILDAIERIRHYSSGLDSAAFAVVQKTIDTVVRNIEIIGEVARNVPNEVEC